MKDQNLSDFKGEGIAGGVSGGAVYTGHRLEKDLKDLTKRMARWRRDTSTISGNESLSDMSRALRKYTEGGRNVMQKRVLGLPLPYLIPKARVQAGQILGAIPVDEAEGLKHHYNMFKKAPQKELNDYMFNKIIDETKFGQDLKSMPVEAEKVLKDTSQPYGSRIKNFKNIAEGSDPDAMNKFKNAFREKADLWTRTPEHPGYSDVYTSLFRKNVPKLKTVAKTLKRGGLTGAGLAGIFGIKELLDNDGKDNKGIVDKTTGFISDNPYGIAAAAAGSAGLGLLARQLLSSDNKNEQSPKSRDSGAMKIAQDTDEEKSEISGIIAGGGILGGSSLTAGYGLKEAGTKKGLIGVGYGGEPAIGSGHKEPGKAIFKDLAREIRRRRLTDKLNVTAIPRGKTGVLNLPFGKTKMEAVVETGFGNQTPDRNPMHRLTGGADIEPKVKVPPRGRYFYQTDVASNTSGPGVAVEMGKNPDFPLGGKGGTAITYGKVPQDKLGNLRNLEVSEDVITPGLETGVMDQLSGINAQNEDTAARRLADTLSKEGKFKEAKKLQHNLDKGKKHIVVSGSGRGDTVTLRALGTQNALKKLGLNDKYGVIALTAGEKDFSPLRQLLDKSSDVVTVDKLPKNEFLNAQRSGIVHWASTGASSSAESLLHRTPTAFMSPEGSKLNKWRNIVQSLSGIDKGSLSNIPTPEPGRAWEQVLSGTELDQWNRGVMDNFPGRTGMYSADTPEQIINLAEHVDKNKGNLDKAIQGRIDYTRRQMDKGKNIMTDDIIKNALKNRKLRKLRGAGLAGGSLLGSIWGGRKLWNSLMDKDQEPERPSWLPADLKKAVPASATGGAIGGSLAALAMIANDSDEGLTKALVNTLLGAGAGAATGYGLSSILNSN